MQARAEGGEVGMSPCPFAQSATLMPKGPHYTRRIMRLAAMRACAPPKLSARHWHHVQYIEALTLG